MAKNYDALAEKFAALAVTAGAVVMEVYAAPHIETRHKSDSSPVSEADERAEVVILRGLAEIFPGVPVIAEESASRGETPRHETAFLLVDPLDGTKEFIGRRKEFTVNIALVEDGRPRAGAIFAPALGQLWLGGAKAFAIAVEPGGKLPERDAWREIRTRRRPDSLVAVMSRSHLDEETEAFLDSIGVRDRLPAGSSLKFCRIAEGAADVYPRFGPTMEWDIAAGDAILTAAGGAVLDPHGAPLRYGKVDTAYRNGSFVAWGDPEKATLS